jgi:hypothetical protein
MLAVRENYIKSPQDALSAYYAVTMPTFDDIRFLTASQWLDNLRCDDKGKPRKWMQDGSLNPAFAGF